MIGLLWTSLVALLYRTFRRARGLIDKIGHTAGRIGLTLAVFVRVRCACFDEGRIV